MGFFFLRGWNFQFYNWAFLGSESGIMERWLGDLLVVVGPGGRISTVDCSRVLNVNRSLYSSTSRGRAQRDV